MYQVGPINRWSTNCVDRDLFGVYKGSKHLNQSLRGIQRNIKDSVWKNKLSKILLLAVPLMYVSISRTITGLRGDGGC